MMKLKQAIKLANHALKNSPQLGLRSKKVICAAEFHKGWWLGFPDECEWGGLLFVVKDTGQVLWGNPPPLEYIHNGESPRKVPDEEFHEAAGYECTPPTQGR